MARYDINGNLDITFGAGGKIITPIGPRGGAIADVALQSDGKFVVAGSTTDANDNSDFLILRYTVDGSLDSSFGTGGRLITDVGARSEGASSIAIQNDGKIIVAGYISSTGIALVRVTISGGLDTSFGNNGKVITDYANTYNEGCDLALQGDGKILVAGRSGGYPDLDFEVIRYTSTGGLDLEFGIGGKVTTDFGSNNDQAESIALQFDGKIVVAGHAGEYPNQDFALARYTSNGALDSTFGVGGKVTTDFGEYGDDAGASVLVQQDGKIIVAGYTVAGGNGFALARYTSAGTLDTSFGIGGEVTTHFNGPYGYPNEYASSLALQDDGKILVAGRSYNSNGTNLDFAIARYLAAPPPIVFIPGIAGSVLEGGIPYRELWPTVLPANINELALSGGPDNKKAVALVMQAYGEPFYNKFVEHFTPADGSKYVLYDLARNPDRMTSTYMLDQAALNPEAPRPTFFPFPYDWRKSNAAHTGTLKQYIKRIKELHGGSKVDIVTHSMGGLLMRRYFLDFPADASADVRKVVSIAAPFWGAPKAVFRLLTGDFYDTQLKYFPLTNWEIDLQPIDYITRDSMKVAFATLPAVHELLPSSTYFSGGGTAVLGEDGFDLNGDGLSYNLFTGSSYRGVLDKQVRLWEPWIPLPSSNNTSFHTSLQDNWFFGGWRVIRGMA